MEGTNCPRRAPRGGPQRRPSTSWARTLRESSAARARRRRSRGHDAGAHQGPAPDHGRDGGTQGRLGRSPDGGLTAATQKKMGKAVRGVARDRGNVQGAPLRRLFRGRGRDAGLSAAMAAMQTTKRRARRRCRSVESPCVGENTPEENEEDRTGEEGEWTWKPQQKKCRRRRRLRGEQPEKGQRRG